MGGARARGGGGGRENPRKHGQPPGAEQSVSWAVLTDAGGKMHTLKKTSNTKNFLAGIQVTRNFN